MKYKCLAVVVCSYDGRGNNGMPFKEANQRMLDLEDAIEKVMNKSNSFQQAYVRTGCHLKELAYYCESQESFNELFGKAVKKHKPFPVEVKFINDSNWNELRRLMQMFKRY